MESRADGAAVRVVLAYVILGPLFALQGTGVTVIVVPLASAIAGCSGRLDLGFRPGS